MSSRTMKVAGILLLVAVSTSILSCGTYYDPSDSYVRGLRWFDRGQSALAREAWEPLAKAGDCDAQARLGHLLFTEAKPGAEQLAAASMLHEAAERGHPFAQIWYGVLHTRDRIELGSGDVVAVKCDGCGVSNDLASAFKWISLGKQRAVYSTQRKFAESILPTIKAKMTPSQLREAELAITAWQPSGLSCKPRELL